MPLVALLLRYLRSPEAVTAFFQWEWGVLIFVIGVAFDVIGLLVIERLCRARV